MSDRVILTPVETMDTVPDLDERYDTYIDHVHIEPPPSTWNPHHVVIFRATKTPRHHLMTTAAHFYGPECHGVVVYHDKVMGTIRPMLVADVRNGLTDGRRMTLALRQPTGGPLPATSKEYYPSGSTVTCPVSKQTFDAVGSCDDVYLLPDPDRVDPASTPPEQWVYAMAGRPPSKPEPHGVLMRCISRHRRVVLKSGQEARYAIRGPILRSKIIETPLSRNVGAHVAQGPPPRDRALAGTTGQKLRITTTKRVKEGEDFIVSKVPLRVWKIKRNGFEAARLIAQGKYADT